MQINFIVSKDIEEGCTHYNVCRIRGNEGPLKFHIEAIMKTLENIKNKDEIPCLEDINFCLVRDGKCFFEYLINELRNKEVPFKKIYLKKFFCYGGIEEEYSFLIEP